VTLLRYEHTIQIDLILMITINPNDKD